jgi:uncharacterized protein YjiS (DUF1127 family)
MVTHQTRYITVNALFRIAMAVQRAAHGLRFAAKRLDDLLERRRVAAAALRDFATMGERDLQDIGITRVDVHRVAWGASVWRP